MHARALDHAVRSWSDRTMRRPALALARSCCSHPPRHPRQGRGHVLQLGDPEPGRPPHRLHADHLRHPPARGAGRPDHGPGGRPDLPLHLRRRRRGGRAVGRHLPAQHDPRAALSEPRRGSSSTGASRPRSAVMSRCAADLGRDADVARRVPRAPGVRVGRLTRGRARDRRGHHPHVVGGRRPDAGERGRDRAAPRRRRDRGIRRAALRRARADAPRARGPRGDGGLSEAASGKPAIAAVTSWSRARAFQAHDVRGSRRGDGAGRRVRASALAPQRLSDLVRDPAAPRRRARPRRAPDHRRVPEVPDRPPRRRRSFRQRGMLLVEEPWPPCRGRGPTPSRNRSPSRTEPEPEPLPEPGRPRDG